MDHVDMPKSAEFVVDHGLRLVGSAIEVFGVLIIVVGIGWSTYRYLRGPSFKLDFETYKIHIGRSLLLGLEVLVAADIVKTVAEELTFTSLGQLAGLLLIRTFLSWTLVLEIERRWPWRRGPASDASQASAGK